MTTSSMRRAGLGLGLLLVGLVAAPSALANERGGDVTCTIRDERILSVIVGSGAEAVISRSPEDGLILVNGHECGGFISQVADVWNTRSVQVSGGDGSQKVRIELDHGGFAPGLGNEPGVTDEIEFSVLLGKGFDQLRIDGTPGADDIAFGWRPGNMAPIPTINLKANDGDWDVSYLSIEYVSAWGYEGNDELSGNDPGSGSTAWLPLYLWGGVDDDHLTGGDGIDHLYAGSGGDILQGGKADDKLVASDGVGGNDFLYGGGGTDVCISDPEDFVAPNCE